MNENYGLDRVSSESKLMRPNYMPSLLEMTKNEIGDLEKRLADKKELVQLLENEPKLQRVLELMANRY